MGILSEIDMMNRDAEDDAFEVSSDSETVDSFSEEFEPVETQKQEPQAEDAEEARKKAEFDAAEAKRKAEWEAKQAQKKLREQQELDRLAAMSDDDVMQASMNRVSQDTERLTRRNMKLCVMEDVQTECLADPVFARLVMKPKKKMVNCFHYINRKAREYLEQEMKDNDEKPMGGGFGGDVPDELCYQWAREYFRDADAKEDAEPEEKFVPKTYNECTVCREKFIGMPRIGIARSGEQRGICPACYAQVVDVCGNCTIHSDCLSIGANRFCPNQMSGLAA